MRFKACTAVLILFLSLFCLFPLAVNADTFAISPAQGVVGSEITIDNICSYGSDDYFIYWGEEQETIKQGNASGCHPVTFTVPDAARGAHPIVLKIDGKTFDSSFTVLPSISINNAEGNVGSDVTITGTGFAANESGIQVLFNEEQVQTGIIADKKGFWQATFKIPQGAAGEHNIDAAGATAASDVEDLFYIIRPKIDINPVSGQVGTMVTVEGNGFGKSETDVKITFDDAVVKTAITANSDGFWRSSFFIPPSTKGVHTISAFGDTSMPEDIADVLFTISPSIKLELAEGVLGSAVKTGDSFWVSGVGFEENESGIQVTFDGTMLTSGIIADAKGSWAIKVAVPLTTQGEHAVAASGSTTKAEDVAGSKLVISAGIQINPTTGAVGQEISVMGTGFGPSQKITLSFDGNQVGMPTSTDNRGSFNTAFTVPDTTGGVHLIMAADASATVASASYETESQPPPAPKQITPEAGAKLGKIGGTIVTFNWGKVDDPSGVSYILELSRSPDFAGTVMRKESLTSNEYTLSSAEALSNGEYFWRVKAVDGALNEGEWSNGSSFKIQALEIVFLALICVLGVAILIAIIWRLVHLSKHGWK
ncbi:MAG: IPT/TIG domain-containing protein [Dehalococcoidia bacterium]|nr:IPT/TIG domain-containing protein [Dehalococcoidia bacterium]